jgi:hypothetical protein
MAEIERLRGELSKTKAELDRVRAELNATKAELEQAKKLLSNYRVHLLVGLQVFQEFLWRQDCERNSPLKLFWQVEEIAVVGDQVLRTSSQHPFRES